MNKVKSNMTDEQIDQMIAETEAARLAMDFSNETPEQIEADKPANLSVKMTPTYNPEDTQKFIDGVNTKVSPLKVPESTQVPPFVGKPGNAYMADIDALMNTVQKPSDNDLEEFRKIQKDSRDKQGVLQVLQAAGSGMGNLFGAKVDPDYMKGIIDQAGTAPKDYLEAQTEKRSKENQYNSNVRSTLDNAKVKQELGDKLAENDPNSTVSGAFRDFTQQYLTMMGSKMTVDDNLSYADLQKQMGTLGNILTTKFAAEQRAALARENSADRALKREQLVNDKDSKKEIDNLNWADKTATALTKNPYIANYNKIKQNAAQFDNAMNNPSGVADIAALYSFVKFLDQESAVREGEIDLILKGVGGLDTVKLKIEKALADGNDVTVIPKAMVQAMAKSNSILKQNLSKNVKAEMDRVKLQADKRGADIYTAVPNYDNFLKEVTPQNDDAKIESFMKKNNIKSKEEAISILKQNGKI